MHRLMLLSLSMSVAAGAAAHDGHHMAGMHLHASDGFGFVLIAAVLGGWWLLRGRR
jgi:hypothetical protein